MDAPLAVISATLAGLGLGAAVYYAIVLGRVLRARRTIPTARAGLSMETPLRPDGSVPPVCVVVPAHNEQDVIADLVASLLAQDYPDLRVVLALDRCDDATQERARAAGARADGSPDPRLEIVEVRECPDDWAGKVHAAHRGVVDSAGARGAELLLFADADTVFEPGLVRASVALLEARALDMLSLLSTLTTDRWFERLVQPAAAFELVRQFPLDLVNREGSRRSFANGQFMLFRRAAYEEIGGHGAVREELLEDIAFARRIQHRRWSFRLGVFLADGLLRCRMYDSWPAFVRGWKRIYTEAAKRYPGRLRRNAWRLRLVGVLLPLGALGAVVAGVAGALAASDPTLGVVAASLGAAGLAAFAWASGLVFAEQRAPLAWLALYPVGAWLVSGIKLKAASDLTAGRATEWAGRRYTREVNA